MQQPAIPSEPALAKVDNPVLALSRFPAWLLSVLLGLGTMALYWPATRCEFVIFDDPLYVLDNAHVTSGLTLENVVWAFRTGYAFNWHPVTWLSHMLDCQMYGLNPWGHHLSSVLLHSLNTVLVFLLLQQMTGAKWRSLFTAALFSVHPLHVESVAWVAERKDMLSGCFGLLTLIFYTRYVSELKIKNAKLKISYWLSFLCFALGLMCKPMLVTWPFVMLLLDFWPLRRGERGEVKGEKADATHLSPLWGLVAEKIPFFALAAMSSIVTFEAQKQGDVVLALPWSARIGNALISYCRYLGKLFWPTKLAVYYPFHGHWPGAEVLIAAGLLLGISALFLALRRHHPFLLMGWLWFVGTLVPVIGFVQVGTQAMADRYTYLSSLGVLILAIWWIYERTRSWHHQVIGLSVAGLAVIFSCSVLTRQQLRYWQDSVTLFQHAVDVTENNYLEHNDLGFALYQKGRVEEAIRQYQEAIRVRPDYTDAHDNLGIALASVNRIDEAIEQFQDVLRLNSGATDGHNHLGNALYLKGRIDEAIREYQQALRLKPDDAIARHNLDVALAKNQASKAIRQYREALRMKPDDAQAHYDLGIALAGGDEIDEAISEYEAAIRLKPDYAQAHYILGTACFAKGRIDEAIRQFQETLRLEPDDAQAHNNLGIAYAQNGQMSEAADQFREALRLKPDYAAARDNLARALETKSEPASR